ncbi:MAG: hypothetical protein CMM07_16675 [Rhodopirellula sp.]|nr:hypothetical protein [Rhodopirellula sp.]
MRTARQNPKINFTIIKQHTATKLWDAETAATLLEQKPIKKWLSGSAIVFGSSALVGLREQKQGQAHLHCRRRGRPYSENKPKDDSLHFHW